MRVIPDVTVIVPADAIEAKKALPSAIEYKGPVYIRLGRPEISVVTDGKSPFAIGKAGILRNGSDISIIACEGTRPPVYRIGIRDVFGEFGGPDGLIKKHGLSWQDIVKAARKVLSLKGD